MLMIPLLKVRIHYHFYIFFSMTILNEHLFFEKAMSGKRKKEKRKMTYFFTSKHLYERERQTHDTK